MYRCGNKVEIGDCVTVNVSVMVTEMNVLDEDNAKYKIKILSFIPL